MTEGGGLLVEAESASRYALSFTSGTLLTREALIAAPIYLESRDWAAVRVRIGEGNLLQARTVRSGFRLAREVVQRLAELTDTELTFLLDATPTERAHLMWVAACRRYDFIGEFAEEVLRERFLLLTASLTYEDFDAFVRSKALWHPELDDLKDSTRQKLRSSLFKMMYEAGFWTKTGQLVPAVLSERFADLLGARRPSDLRYIPAATPAVGGTR